MDRGELVWEYRPPRAHPILYAGLLLTAAVFVLGALENLLRDNKPELYAVYAAPPVVLLALFALLFPSSVRIHRAGVAPSRPVVLRWHRPFLPFADQVAVYPVAYDVTGAFVSPFASSDGKVTQLGVGLEDRHGRIETIRLTPTRFSQTSRRSRGFREAWPLVRDLYTAQGRPCVADAPSYSPEERASMEAEARKPFLPFFAIVFLFACAAPVLWILTHLGVPVPVALPLCLVLPVATSLRSWTQSQRRNRILNALSKSAEHAREAGGETGMADRQGAFADASTPAAPSVEAA